MRNIVVALLVLSVIISIAGTWIILEETYSKQAYTKEVRDYSEQKAKATFTVVDNRPKQTHGKVALTLGVK